MNISRASYSPSQRARPPRVYGFTKILNQQDSLSAKLPPSTLQNGTEPAGSPAQERCLVNPWCLVYVTSVISEQVIHGVPGGCTGTMKQGRRGWRGSGDTLASPDGFLPSSSFSSCNQDCRIQERQALGVSAGAPGCLG